MRRPLAPQTRATPRTMIIFAAAIAFATVLTAGCGERSPAPARVRVPPPEPAPRFERDPVKPLPGETSDTQVVAPPFNDAPLVNQRPPEEPAFVDAYTRVGRPRILVIAVSGSINDRTMEESLADTLGCNGQVLLTSPDLARRFLGDRRAQDLRGNSDALRDLAQQVNADVLVEAQEQSAGRESDAPVRVIVEAMNTRGGQSLGRAVIDVPPPLDAPRIEHFTRYVARKLMDEMTAAWNAPPPPELRRDNPRESTTPPPTTATGATAPTAPSSTTPPPPTMTSAPATQPSR